MVILLDNQASIVRIVQATDVHPEIEKSGVRLDLDDSLEDPHVQVCT